MLRCNMTVYYCHVLSLVFYLFNHYKVNDMPQ